MAKDKSPMKKEPMKKARKDEAKGVKKKMKKDCM